MPIQPEPSLRISDPAGVLVSLLIGLQPPGRAWSTARWTSRWAGSAAGTARWTSRRTGSAAGTARWTPRRTGRRRWHRPLDPPEDRERRWHRPLDPPEGRGVPPAPPAGNTIPQEAGFAFWNAVSLAQEANYKSALQELQKARDAHDRLRKSSPARFEIPTLISMN